MKNPNLIDLSIIILTWNTKKYIYSFLKSIEKFKNDLVYEIIVIDNGSTDKTIEDLSVDYPEIVCVRNDTNKGTSQRNKGLQISHGKYVAFVDSDIELLENHTFDMLVEFLKKNKDVGLVAPQLVLDNGEIQLSCKNFLSFYTPIMRRFDFLPFIKKTRLYRDQLLADWDHRETRYVDYTVSAFWVFRKEIYNNIGGLDEKIFYAPEDVDYCLRIRKSGYKVAYFPSVKVKHHYQRITRKIFSKITYEHIKGLLYYFKKHKYLLKPKI